MIYTFYFTKVVLCVCVCVFRSPSAAWQRSRCGSDFDFSFYHQFFLAELRRNSSPQGVAPEIRFKRHVQTNLQPIHLHEETDLPRNKEVHVAPPGLRLAALNNQELTFWLWLDKSSGWCVGPGVFHNSHSGDLGTKPATCRRGCSWTSLLMFPDPVTLLLEAAGESLSSLPLSFLLCHVPFKQLLSCSSSLSSSQPIVQYFRFLCPSAWWHYISVLKLWCG